VRLADFFRAMEPMLAARQSAADTARLLYGEAPGRDGERLALYQSMCRWRRADTLAGVFPRVRAALVAAAGERAFTDLCTEYYAAAPWRAIRPLPNAAGFSAFLARVGPERGLPDHLAELADFEWWVLATRVAPEPDEDPAGGPLRLAHTAELRPYRYDLVGWIDEVEAAAGGAPAPGRFAVLFWRDREQVACVRAVTQGELRLLAAVRAGAAAGLGEDERAAAERLHRLGVLVGAGRPWR